MKYPRAKHHFNWIGSHFGLNPKIRARVWSDQSYLWFDPIELNLRWPWLLLEANSPSHVILSPIRMIWSSVIHWRKSEDLCVWMAESTHHRLGWNKHVVEKIRRFHLSHGREPLMTFSREKVSLSVSCLWQIVFFISKETICMMFFPIIIARQSEDFCAPMVGIEHRHFVILGLQIKSENSIFRTMKPRDPSRRRELGGFERWISITHYFWCHELDPKTQSWKRTKYPEVYSQRNQPPESLDLMEIALAVPLQSIATNDKSSQGNTCH